jgi:hydrogenase maturation factor
MYAGVVITDDHLSSELISAGDVAVFRVGKAGRIGDLVVVYAGYGIPEVKKMKAGERCMVLGAVVRIERDFN